MPLRVCTSLRHPLYRQRQQPGLLKSRPLFGTLAGSMRPDRFSSNAGSSAGLAADNVRRLCKTWVKTCQVCATTGAHRASTCLFPRLRSPCRRRVTCQAHSSGDRSGRFGRSVERTTSRANGQAGRALSPAKPRSGGGPVHTPLMVPLNHQGQEPEPLVAGFCLERCSRGACTSQCPGWRS